MNLGASAPQYSLAISTASSIATSTGHLAVLDLVQRHPHHVEVQRRDPVDRPALGVVGDRLVELFALGVDALGQLAGQRPRVGDQLLQRAAGDVALVAGEDGVAALVGSAHRFILAGFAGRGSAQDLDQQDPGVGDGADDREDDPGDDPVEAAARPRRGR